MQTDAMLCDRDQMTAATTSNMSKDAAAVINRGQQTEASGNTSQSASYMQKHTVRALSLPDTGVLLMYIPWRAQVISSIPPVWYLVVNRTLSQGRAAVQAVQECPAVSVPRSSSSHAVHRPPVQSGSAVWRTAVIMTSHAQLSRVEQHLVSHRIPFTDGGTAQRFLNLGLKSRFIFTYVDQPDCSSSYWLMQQPSAASEMHRYLE